MYQTKRNHSKDTQRSKSKGKDINKNQEQHNKGAEG